MKMKNNYMLIKSGQTSYFFDKREIQFVKYSDGVLFIKLKCFEEVDYITLNQEMATYVINELKEFEN